MGCYYCPFRWVNLFFGDSLVKKQHQVRAKILHWFPALEDSAGDEIADIAVLELVLDSPLPSGLRPVSLVVTEQQAGFSAESKVRMCGFPAGVDQGTYANGILQGVTAGSLIEIHSRDYTFASRDEQKQQGYNIDELQEQWELHANRLQAMEKDRILETRAEERLRLEYRIKETRAERDSVEQRLAALQGNSTTQSQVEKSCTSGFDGTPVWAVQENAVCGMAVTMLNRQNTTVSYMIPAALLLAAFPEMEKLSRPANPYLGLEAFKEKDAKLYFGRRETVTRIQRTVEEQDVIAVIGASGSGKSSAVFAGLVPILRRTGDWLITRCLPRKQPFYELSSALVPFLYDDPLLRLEKSNELREKLHAGSLTLGSIIHQISGQNDNRRFLLIVDQFEELFTLNADRELISRYIESLLEARNTENFTVLITMRADFLESAAGYPALAEALSHCPPFIIPPMNENDLREAVEQPAAMFGVEFEPGLAQLIVQDVGSEPGSLPLLEFCLTQLWERQEFRRISHDAYTTIGGVHQALANHADEVYEKFKKKFKKQGSERLRHIFLKLVRPGQGTEDTRQVAVFEQISQEDRELITWLADHRLVVTGRVEEEDTVEVVHEALIRRWRTLQQWVDEDRDFLVWQEKLRMLLRQWQESKKDDGALLRGHPLGEALKWRESHNEYLGVEEKGFIQESEYLRDREKRKREQEWLERERLFLEANYNLAKVFEEKALAALEQAEKTHSNKLYKQTLLFALAALELKIEAGKTALEPNSIGKLFATSIFNAALAEQWVSPTAAVSDICWLSFNPDGTRLASRSGDSTIRIWDIENGKELTELRKFGHSSTGFFSPDGAKIVSSGADLVQIWDIEKSRELTVFKAHGRNDIITEVSFNPNGTILAIGSMNSESMFTKVQIWDIEKGKEDTVISIH